MDRVIPSSYLLAQEIDVDVPALPLAQLGIATGRDLEQACRDHSFSLLSLSISSFDLAKGLG